MSTPYQTVYDAVVRSISHNEIVHLEHDDLVRAELLDWAEDWNTGDIEIEAWGDYDGHEWRVHIKMPPRPRTPAD